MARKKTKRITLAEVNRARKKLGMEPIPRRKSLRTICKEEAKAVDLPVKQRFMSLMKDGKTLGEASEICGISQLAAVGILEKQKRTYTYYDFEVKE